MQNEQIPYPQSAGKEFGGISQLLTELTQLTP